MWLTLLPPLQAHMHLVHTGLVTSAAPTWNRQTKDGYTQMRS